MSESVPPPGGDPRYGSGRPPVSGSEPVPGPEGVPTRPGSAPDPLSTTLLRVAGVLAVLLIAVVVNSLLHGGEDGGLNPVAQAAVKTQRQPGAKIAMEAIYTSPGSSIEVKATGGGVYEAKHHRSKLSLSLPIGSTSFVVEATGDDHASYMRTNAPDQHLPPGKSWIEVQPFFGRSAEAALASSGGAGDTLRMLEAAGGSVDSLGEEEVRGVLTHRYSTTIDLGDFADHLSNSGEKALGREYQRVAELIPGDVQEEVWIDDHGLVRRVRTQMPLPHSEGGPELNMDMRMDFYGFGSAPKVELPPANAVIDVTPLAKAELHLIDGTAFGSLRPPAGAAALSTAKFRQRANGICQGFLNDGKQLGREAVPEIEAMKRLGVGGPDSVTPDEALPVFREYVSKVFRPSEKLAIRLLHQLAAVPPPAADAANYGRFLRNGAEQLEILRGEGVGFTIGDFKIGEKLKPGRKKLNHESDALARKLHLPACGKQGDEESGFSASGPSTNSA